MSMCRRFVKLGTCPLGPSCPQAHSKKELKFNSEKDWVQVVGHLGLTQKEHKLQKFDTFDQTRPRFPILKGSASIPQLGGSRYTQMIPLSKYVGDGTST